jgi:hypothetical protein
MTTKQDQYDGLSGSSNSPYTCPDCDMPWTAAERIETGDMDGIGGYEDWCYCERCETELFYPVVHRPDRSLYEFFTNKKSLP